MRTEKLGASLLAASRWVPDTRSRHGRRDAPMDIFWATFHRFGVL